MSLFDLALKDNILSFLKEDGIFEDLHWLNQWPEDEVEFHLLAKSPLILVGLPAFFAVFKTLIQAKHSWIDLYSKKLDELEQQAIKLEGKRFGQSGKPEKILSFKVPFNVGILAERVALNLLHRLSSIATVVGGMAQQANPYGIKILDTRKTTPGLRNLEKYAVAQSGGYNHRHHLSDALMIKDNHKNFFGGINCALEFFRNQKSFYRPIILELHDINEWNEILQHGVSHVMLDNWQVDDIRKALKEKPKNMTVELSGSIGSHNLAQYLIYGVDAISVGGSLEYPPKVDLSLKIFS